MISQSIRQSENESYASWKQRWNCAHYRKYRCQEIALGRQHVRKWKTKNEVWPRDEDCCSKHYTTIQIPFPVSQVVSLLCRGLHKQKWRPARLLAAITTKKVPSSDAGRPRPLRTDHAAVTDARLWMLPGGWYADASRDIARVCQIFTIFRR